MRSVWFAPFITVLACVLAISASYAEIPQVISYQGKVTDSSGDAIADGTYTMRFRIYDAVTGGTMEWDSGNQTVSVSGGIFSVMLGEGSPISLPFDEDYWLEVVIQGDTQSPRQRLGSVGYAYMASGVVAGTAVSGSVSSGTYATLQGVNYTTSGLTYGLSGLSYSTGGKGVYGWALATEGVTSGVHGRAQSADGYGVSGFAQATTGLCFGVYGESSSGVST